MTISLEAKANGTQGTIKVNGADAWLFDGTGVDSPVSLAASISANAITVTLSKGGWRFRNTTLSNGAPSYVKTDTDLTLTIASTDSFGLVTAAGNQRLAIILFNDAGTLRLAASAIYGGVNLDETNLLSATTTATTATAIESGVVVASKAYRLVGFVDATFTTAVGWGSLGTVQSIGGQALAAMSSLGYGQTWQAVTRNATTTYYNTTGKPILFYMSFAYAAGSNDYVVVTINSVAINFIFGVVVAGVVFGSGSIVIPPGASYSYTAGGGAKSIYELR